MPARRIRTAARSGGEPDGAPTGVLHEAAARLVSGRVPLPTPDELVEAIPPLAREAVALGVVAVHDPGGLVPATGLGGAFAAYARLSDAGRLPVRVHACLRQESLETAAERGLRSGSVLGSAADGRARVGWLKLFADGSLGSRTAALLEPFTFEPDRPLQAGRERGIFITEPPALAELRPPVPRGPASSPRSTPSGTRPCARRSMRSRRTPAGGPLVPRVEHVQLVDPADLPRFARHGIAASVQPVHLRSDAAQARHLWGERAERSGYPWRSLAESGALLPFGTDAPIEPIDPWPGIAIAVTRADASWPPGHRAVRSSRGARPGTGDPRRLPRRAAVGRRAGSGPAGGRPARGHRRPPGRRPWRSRSRSAGRSGSSARAGWLVDGEIAFEA